MGGPRAAAVFLALVLAATSRGGATSRGSSSDEPPAAATCSFASHDWNAAHTLKSVSASTPAECCAKCAAAPGCEAGVLDAGQCYLKAGDRVLVPNNGSTAGYCAKSPAESADISVTAPGGFADIAAHEKFC
jgi:hypothetical protein